MTVQPIPSAEAAMDDPVAAAEGFLPEIAERAAEIEELRHVPEDLAQRLAAAGFYRLCTPAHFGGLERSPLDYARVVETLATADGSVAWCTFIGMTSALGVASVDDAEARRLLSDPLVKTAGVFAPKGKARRACVDGVDGYRVSGQWQWGSGSKNADWITGGAMVVDEAGEVEKTEKGFPQVLTVVFHKSEIEILDTWHVTGLRGTGSNDYAVRDVFVPEARVAQTFGSIKVKNPIYAFPPFGFLGIGIGAVALGLARAAIDELVRVAMEKTPQGSSKTLAMRSATHRDVAKAEALVRSARAYFYQVIEEAWDVATSDGAIEIEHRRDIRLATTHAVKAAVEAVDLMYTLAGGTSVYASSPLQRHFRDVHVATQHMMVADATYDLIGRFFLGLETSAAQL